MRYTETHEWVEIDEERHAIVGITDYAQRELGDVVYVELPQVGKEVAKGDEVAVLESTKAASDIYTPLSGKIIAVNEALAESPELINSAAESEGWIFKLAPSNRAEMEELLTPEQYNAGLN